MMDDKKLSIINHRREKAFDTLKDIETLLQSNLLNTAMNRIYYAGFYIVSALALIDNFSTSKHKQLIGYFNKNYVHSGKIEFILNIAYLERTSIDHYYFTKITMIEVLQFIEEWGSSECEVQGVARAI